MANQIGLFIYRKNGNNLGSTTGKKFSFPAQAIYAEPVSGVTADGATINAVVKFLPERKYRDSDEFYTDSTVAAIVTAANA